MIKNKYDYIEVSDLSYDMQLLVGKFGIVFARELMKLVGGKQLYIPKFESMREAHKRIITELGEMSAREIAGIIGVSEMHIRNLKREML